MQSSVKEEGLTLGEAALRPGEGEMVRRREFGPDRILGCFCDGIGDQEMPMVMGATVATSAFLKALVRHGSMDRYEFFAQTGNEEGVQQQVSRFLAAVGIKSETVRVSSYERLLVNFQRLNITAWHDPAGLPDRAFYLRRIRSGSLYPITFSHHTISYQQMLHNWVLPLLLTDTFPCDSVICTTRAARTAMANLFEKVGEEFNRSYGTRIQFRGRMDVIPLGVDTDIFKPRDKADLRLQMGLPQDAIILLCLGRISAIDKMDLMPLLKCFRALVDDNPGKKLFLVIAGSERGGYASVVWQYAESLGLKEHVGLMVHLPIRQQHVLHSAADIFISLSDNIQECFGLSPIEAMACGVPQVVTDWDGYKDTVSHEVTGFRVPTYWARCDGDLEGPAGLTPWEKDHLTLAQSVVVDMDLCRNYLQELIRNEELRREMGRRSRERALSLFSWKNVISQYEALWNDLTTVAGQITYNGPFGRAYSHPQYYSVFRHFATGEVSGQMPLILTPSGSRILRGKQALPNSPGLEKILNEDLLKRAMVAVKTAAHFRRAYPFDSLVEDLSKGEDLSPDFVCRHVMWLLKYGIFEPPAGQFLPWVEGAGMSSGGE